MKKHIFLLGMLCLYQSIASLTTSAQSFIQNVGQVTDQYLQTRNDIDFKISQQKGMQVFIGNGKIHYQWMDKDLIDTNTYQSYRLDMELIGANLQSPIDLGSVTNSYERYFLPWVNTQNSNEGKIAHQYQSITYKNIYPDIDWKLYFTADGKLEYDFILGTNAKVSDIKMKYSGMDSIKIANGGQLQIYTPKGIIREQAPYSYESESKKIINSSFVLQGETIGFKTGAYKGCLTIDPIVEWGTYYGGTDIETSWDITHDEQHNYYLVGGTSSNNNIVTAGAHQQTFGGGSNNNGADGFISKFTSDGQLVWSTYFGGNNIDLLKQIKYNQNGHLYIAGMTNSATGIASSSAFQITKMGNAASYDAVLIKIDTNGVIAWSTYFGGALNDGNTSIALDLDTAKNPILAGNTQSTDLYTTANAYSNTRQLEDGFITKFNTNGTPIWSTYFGGNNADIINTIKISNDNKIYIAGNTTSTTNLATNNAFQTTLAGNKDAFIAKLDSAGFPIWCTYYGGVNEDNARTITVKDTLVIIGGYTWSNNNISTTNAHQTLYNGHYEGMLVAFNTMGNRIWGTYYGGTSLDDITKVDMDSIGNIIVLLETNSTTNIATNDGINDTLNTKNDIGLVKFSTNGSRIWGTYLGGHDIDNAKSFTLHGNHIVISGQTISGSNIATNGTYQTSLSGASDAFIIKINDCDPPTPITQINGTTAICAGDVVRFEALGSTDAAYYIWILPSTWQGNSDSSSINVTVGTTDDTLKVVAFSACGTPSDTAHFATTVLPLPQAIVTRQGNVLRTTTAFDNYQWLKDNVIIAGAIQPTYVISENGEYSVIVSNTQGCSDTSNIISVNNLSTKHTSNILYSYYPNPITDVLHIQCEQAGQLRMYNVLGQLVMTHNIAKGNQKIDCSKLATGIYKIQLIIDQQYHTFTITKE